MAGEDWVNVGDGEWDFYSGLPNPKWYEKKQTFSDATEDED